MSEFGNKIREVFDKDFKQRRIESDRKQAEFEKASIEAENQKMKPFKIGDTVKIIRHGIESYELEDGWKIRGYSDEFQEALVWKLNSEKEIQTDINAVVVEAPKNYLYDKASVKLLLDWNPEFKLEE